MAILPDFFADPALRARQDQLNAQWNGLWGTYNSTCENGLGNAFPEFATDYQGWKDFYDSESDWSSASKHATDEWQQKAQEWAGRLKGYGCGNQATSDLGIPGVKDPPPDEPGFLDEVGSDIATAGKWVAGLTALAIIAGAIVVVMIFRKGK